MSSLTVRATSPESSSTIEQQKTWIRVMSEPNPSPPLKSLCVSLKKTTMAAASAVVKPYSYPICSTSNSPLKSTAPPCPHKHNQLSLRREIILKGLSLLPLLELKQPRPSSAAKEIEVGSFLPPSPSDPSFVFFKASPKDTPALRAGLSFFKFLSNLSSLHSWLQYNVTTLR